MEGQVLITTVISPNAPVDMVSQFRQEYLTCQALFRQQPTIVQRFLETQATAIAEAIVEGLSQLQFTLPDQVLLQKPNSETKTYTIPAAIREQMIGGLVDRLIHTDLCTGLHSRLLELEQSTNIAVSASAILVRHSVAMYMVHNRLPSGRSVQYAYLEGDEIPSLPLSKASEPNSALIAASDAITVEMDASRAKNGELVVPYVEAARKFYLPQWVSFGVDGNLLVAEVNEAEAHLASMQKYLSVLHTVLKLAPYIVADEEYQRKRYGILGQLVNQGRALAHYQVKEIIKTIQRRAASHELDRGLSLSLPYFNDQTLKVEEFSFDVIPVGRVMFVPAFVVLAVRAQALKVAQDTRLSQSTRRQILTELGTLEGTFLR